MFGGQVVQTLPANRVARQGMGLVPQGPRIFADPTVKENLQFAVKPGPWDLARVYRVFARLLERQRFRGDQLPAGEQPMFASGRAADEPAATPDGSALRRAGTACRRRDRGRDPPA
jgi:branched-chain amino acid transport system ATP-binding protein